MSRSASERGSLTCQELIDFLADYLEGELPPKERGVFDEHLGACPDCSNYLDSYRSTIDLGRAACDGDDLPDEVPEDLVQAILAARR